MPCFVCGKAMRRVEACMYAWQCPDCEVFEECSGEPFVSRVKTVPECIWFGQELEFINHATENFPSPA